jgi:hypothetical protein
VTLGMGESKHFAFPDQSPTHGSHVCSYSVQLDGSNAVVPFASQQQSQRTAGCAVCENGKLQAYGPQVIKARGVQICGGDVSSGRSR